MSHADLEGAGGPRSAPMRRDTYSIVHAKFGYDVKLMTALFVDGCVGSLNDVLWVGRRKALGFISLNKAGTLPVAPLIQVLRRRGIAFRLMLPSSTHRHRQEATRLLRLLPPVHVGRRVHRAYSVRMAEGPRLYAYDRERLGELLASNRDILRPYPASPEAFIDLINFAMFPPGTAVEALIELALGYPRFGLLYGSPPSQAISGSAQVSGILPAWSPDSGALPC